MRGRRELDDLHNQSLESLFLAGLTQTFSSVGSFFGIDQKEQLRKETEDKLNQEKERKRKQEQQITLELEKMQKQYEETKKSSPIKLDFKERNRLGNGSNYDVRIRMLGFLQEVSMWGHVNGTVPRPQNIRGGYSLLRSQEDTSAQKEWNLIE